MYVPTAALVTNLSVHLKWGREASLVWVTTLDDARPVGGRARVRDRLHGQDGRRPAPPTPTGWRASPVCRGRRPARLRSPSGREDFFDWRQIQPLRGLSGGLLVLAESGDDLGIVHSSWDQGIEPFRFDLPSESLRRAGRGAHGPRPHALPRRRDRPHEARAARSSRSTASPPCRRSKRPHGPLDPPSRQRRALRAAARLARRRQSPRARGRSRATRSSGATRWSSSCRRPRESRNGRRSSAGRAASASRSFAYRSCAASSSSRRGRWSPRRRCRSTSACRTSPAAPPRACPWCCAARSRPRVFPAPAGLDAFTFANGPVRTGVFRDGEDGRRRRRRSRGRSRAQQLTLDAAGTARGRLVLLPPPDVAARAARRAGVPRSQRRGADGGATRAAVAGSLAAGAAHRALGARARRPGGARGGGRRRRRARRRRTGPGRRPRPPHLLDARTRVVGGFYAYEHTRRSGAPASSARA